MKAWAFWDQGPFVAPWWIGPRHTNFNDGSICAFDRNHESAWRFGGSLRQLVDYFTLWTIRHLHLRTFGKWPGMQSVPEALRYERVLEFSPDELCGCGNSRTKYRDCCQRQDRSFSQITLAARYFLATKGGDRAPPLAVSRFVDERDNPPDLGNVFS
jgi:hypothetical protein